MKLDIAVTQPINPSSSSPVLTRAQVWAGLKIKARDPVKFVPIVSKCEVLHEDDAGLTRVVTFKPGSGPPGTVTEVITYVEGVKVDFVTPDSTVSNIISSGNNETDLYLTFTFHWNFPDIAEGSEEAAAKVRVFDGMTREVVPHTIEQIRTLVKDGAIA